MLRKIAAGEVLLAAVNSEKGSDPRHPFAECTKVPAPDLATLQLLQKEVQSAKHFVNHTAIEICDRALSLTGGGGYLNKNPIPRYFATCAPVHLRRHSPLATGKSTSGGSRWASIRTVKTRNSPSPGRAIRLE